MDNYEIARDRAREYFLSRRMKFNGTRPGLQKEEDSLCFYFLGSETRVSLTDGRVFCRYGEGEPWEADFSEALSVYDWLCDAKPDAVPGGDFRPVHSLPGVLVGGNGGGTLVISGGSLPELIDRNPEAFVRAYEALGGRSYPTGDLGCMINLFPDLPVVLKFYHSDEEFPAQLTVLWDRNTLDFVKYETVYYIAGVLFRRLRQKMEVRDITTES